MSAPNTKRPDAIEIVDANTGEVTERIEVSPAPDTDTTAFDGLLRLDVGHLDGGGRV